jgi:hypothetical protein
MKKLVVVLLSLASFLTAQSSSVSGIWNGKGGVEDPKYGSVPMTAQMTLQQAGSSVSGTLKIGNGKIMQITSGAVSGNTITFAVGNGSTTVGSASLTQSGAQLAGKLTSSTGSIFDVVFTQQ